jgi:hypothetical protein
MAIGLREVFNPGAGHLPQVLPSSRLPNYLDICAFLNRHLETTAAV